MRLDPGAGQGLWHVPHSAHADVCLPTPCVPRTSASSPMLQRRQAKIRLGECVQTRTFWPISKFEGMGLDGAAASSARLLNFLRAVHRQKASSSTTCAQEQKIENLNKYATKEFFTRPHIRLHVNALWLACVPNWIPLFSLLHVVGGSSKQRKNGRTGCREYSRQSKGQDVDTQTIL